MRENRASHLALHNDAEWQCKIEFRQQRIYRHCYAIVLPSTRLRYAPNILSNKLKRMSMQIVVVDNQPVTKEQRICELEMNVLTAEAPQTLWKISIAPRTCAYWGILESTTEKTPTIRLSTSKAR